jgi:hypothetical protein
MTLWAWSVLIAYVTTGLFVACVPTSVLSVKYVVCACSKTDEKFHCRTSVYRYHIVLVYCVQYKIHMFEDGQHA